MSKESLRNSTAYRADANERYRSKRRQIDRPKCANPERRKELEADTPAWLKYYLAEAYPLAFGKPHHEIIHGAEEALRTGGYLVTAASRGTGKSTVVNGVCLKFVMTGAVFFPAIIPWKAGDVKKALRFWKNALCSNPRLLEDYPEICQPFAKSKGSAAKITTLTWEDGTPTGAKLSVSDGMIVLPDSRGVIGSATLNGNPRGLYHSTESGAVLRPDLVIIDDPSDKQTAKSEQLTKENIDRIDTDVLGMAGPDNSIPALMTCTRIKPKDTASHYLGPETPEWKSIIIPQIVTWPENRKLWDELNTIRLDQGNEKAIEFYKKHQKKLDQGLTVSWPERYDRKRGEPNALYSAMKDFYKMGETAFASERQNAPEDNTSSTYRITEKLVLKHITKMPPLVLPDNSKILVGYCDINRVGLNWCIAGFDSSMTPHIAAYGKYPQGNSFLWDVNAPELVRKQAIFSGLTKLNDQISKTTFTRNGEKMPLRLLLIDRGYEAETVHRFVMHSKAPYRIAANWGFAAHKYRPRKTDICFERCHLASSPTGGYIAHDSDYWREIAQRAFLADPGAVGGVTLFKASKAAHMQFAEEQCREVLSEKLESANGHLYVWTRLPGANDKQDAYVGCWVAAAVEGLRTDGLNLGKKQGKRKKNKVRMIHV